MTVACTEPANGEDPLLLVLAADHLIGDAAQFRQTINPAASPPKRAAW